MGTAEVTTTTMVKSKGETNETEDDHIYSCNIFCFHELTMIKVSENDKIINRQVSEIKTGDKVLTYNGGKKILTKITKIAKNKGDFEFYEFRCRNKHSNIKSITVTGNHTMIIYSKDNYEIKFKAANQVKIGDLFRTADGMFEIFEINQKRMKDSYELRVENGTVLANDILTSTLYLKNDENIKEYQKIIESSKIPVQILN